MTRAPDFFVIGASKCGTTSLCRQLGGHPSIFMPELKEPHFFTHCNGRERSEAWYASLFAGAAAGDVVGEGSTSYAAVTLFPGVERRISRHAPGARIVYIVRHPLERMESQWLQRLAMGSTDLDFDRAVRELPEMIETNRFWVTESAYRAVVDEDRMLILFYEDFAADPAGTLARCFSFVGVDPDFVPDDPTRRLNPRTALRRDGSFLRALKRLPGFFAVRDALAPPRLRRVLKRPLTRPVPARPRWEPATLAWAAEQVRDGNREFLRRHGKPADFWAYGDDWLAARGDG